MNSLRQYWRSIDWRIRVVNDYLLTKILKFPLIFSPKDTINEAINNNLSISRFGDGEISLVYGKNLHFQKYNKKLGKKLKDILKEDNPELLVCLPDCFNDMNCLCDVDRSFWKSHLLYFRNKWHNILDKQRKYGNTWTSRIYSMDWNKNNAKELFTHLESLWEGKDIVFIEGEFSRLGVGNDCFKKAKTIRRIIGPAENAFDKYEELLKAALSVSDNPIFILALGPTATVLASDLSKEGRIAYDLGHIDIEFEWLRLGAKSKIPIKGKYVNEAFLTGESSNEVNGEFDDSVLQEYQNQIIAKII